MRDARFYVDFIGGGRGTDMNGHEKMKKINRVRKRGRERERERAWRPTEWAPYIYSSRIGREESKTKT